MIWWLPLVLAVPLFFLWSLVHESVHAITAIAFGRKITSFKPWPHKESDWGFVFGSVRFDGVNNIPILIMPYVFDILAYFAFWVAALFVDTDVPRTVFAAVLLCPIVNTTAAVQARYRGNVQSDLARGHWGWALPFLYLIMIYVFLLGILVASKIF